jgi:hypothetical protein
MLFPWVGLFEQIHLADLYIHYDDVQMPTGGSFINRVQIKTKDGQYWLTVPVSKASSNSLISELAMLEETSWRKKQLKFLEMNYAKAPFKNEMLEIANKVYANPTNNLSSFLIAGLEEVNKYLGMAEKKCVKSSELPIRGSSSTRIFDLVRHFGGTNYITGHGAKNYLDHQLFENQHIAVSYMDYQKKPYPQLYGEFTPYVSILDLIANVGKEAPTYLISGTQSWKNFI